MNRIKDEVESENLRLEEIRIRKIKHREEVQAELVDQRHRILEIQEKTVNIRKKFDIPHSPHVTPSSPSTPNLHELISPELPTSLPNILRKQLELFEGRLYKLENDFEEKKSYVRKLDMDYSKLEEKIEQNKIKIQNINKMRKKQYRESKRSGFNFPGVDELEKPIDHSERLDVKNYAQFTKTPSPLSFESNLKGKDVHQHVIASILYCEFEKEIGSRIKFQVPPDSVTEEEFETFAKYITGTEEFCDEILAFTHRNRFFLGLPKVLRHPRYPRNLFLFNVVFVFNKPVPNAPPVIEGSSRRVPETPFTPMGSAVSNKFDHEIRKSRQMNRGFEIGEIMLLYVPILKKLTGALYTLEEQKQMLSCPEKFIGVTDNSTISHFKKHSRSSESLDGNHHEISGNGAKKKNKNKKKRRTKGRSVVLENALTKFYVEITFEKETYLRFDDTSFVHFKLLPHLVQPSPPHLHPHYVPVPLYDLSDLVDHHTDLTFQQIYRHLDGKNHIQRIVEESGVVIRLVYRCVKTLLYYNVVKIIDIFQYSNIYGIKSRVMMNRIFRDKEIQKKCYDYVVLHHRKRYSPSRRRNEIKKTQRHDQIIHHPWTMSPNTSSSSSSITSSVTSTPQKGKSSSSRDGISPLQIIKVYSYFNSRDSVSSILQRHIPPEIEKYLSHRALITFGLVYGIIERIHEIPILDENFYRQESRASHDDYTIDTKGSSSTRKRNFSANYHRPHPRSSIFRKPVLNPRPETPPLRSDTPRTNKYARRGRGGSPSIKEKGEVEREMKKREKFFSTLRTFLNGNNCMDEICCFFHYPKEKMKKKMRKEYDESIYFVRKIMDVNYNSVLDSFI